MIETKQIPIVAAVVGIVFLGVVCGCGGIIMFLAKRGNAPSDAQIAISYILEMDEKISNEKMKGANASEIAASARSYIASAKTLDLSNCPAEFRLAYRRHLEAWGIAASAIDELPDGLVDALVTGFLNATLNGEADGGQSRLDGKLEAAREQIKSTWYAVEDIAVKYGVAKP